MSLKVWPWYCCDLLCMCRTHNFRFHHDCIQNLYIHCGVYTRMHNFLSFFQGWSMIFRFHPNSMICVWIHNHILYRRWDLTKVNMSTNYFETRYYIQNKSEKHILSITTCLLFKGFPSILYPAWVLYQTTFSRCKTSMTTCTIRSVRVFKYYVASPSRVTKLLCSK